ncbi:hypothetical protein ACFY3M_13610 [Streptomyces mirabilis]|uniref:hypothetical protein n=1 Tax=Streptomyces mirabilis TaxID=68239 RepID=UPI0036BE265C
MSDQTAPRTTYQLPDSATLGAAVTEVLNTRRAETEHLGRVMAVVTAAAVRDILTGCDPDAPFDAATLELVEGEDGLFPSGRYWTTDGTERLFSDIVGETDAGNGIHDMSGWTAYLDADTRDVWRDLTTVRDNRDGREVYAFDLARAASLTLHPSKPVPPTPPALAMIEVMVCANDRDRYPALVDPADLRDGYVRPWFDLRTVRRIAADTRRDAARYGHGSIDTVHVLDGKVNRTKHAVVMVVCWMYLAGERREQAAEVLQPNADGRYAVGGHDWQWYALDGDQNPLIPFRPDAV